MENNNFPFSKEYQYALLKLMIVDEVFLMKCAQHVKMEYFDDKYLAWLFNKVTDYYKEYKKAPTLGVLDNEAKKQAIDNQAAYFEVLNRALNTKNDVDYDYVRRELTGFVRRNIFVEAYKRAASLYNVQNTEGAYQFTKSKMDELAQVDFEKDDTVNWDRILDEVDAARESSKLNVPTGIVPIDEAMNGGMSLGSLTTLLAGTNAGKSMALINMGYYAVISGRKVVSIHHEDEPTPTMMRVISRFTGIPYSKLMCSSEVLTTLELGLISVARDCLKKNWEMKFMYGSDTTVEEVADWLRLKKKEFDFDLFIDDYGQFIRTKRTTEGERFTQSVVYRTLKQIALELNVACLTCAQGNREAQKVNKAGTDYLRSTDLSECIRKGTLVLTATGHKPIEGVEVGDHVLTHRGRWRRVLAVTNKGRREIVSTKIDGLIPVYTTADHLFSTTGGWKRAADMVHIARSGDRVVLPKILEPFHCDEESFIDVGRYVHGGTVRGDVIVRINNGGEFDRRINPIKSRISLTPDFAFLLGLLVAEGTVCVDGRTVCVDLHTKERPLQDVIMCGFKNYFGVQLHRAWRPSDCNGWSVRTQNVLLNEFLSATIGRGVGGKHVPSFIWNAPNSVRRAFIDGIVAGDGYHGKHVGLANPVLIVDLQALGLTVGYFYSLGDSTPAKLGRNKSVRQFWRLLRCGLDNNTHLKDHGPFLSRKFMSCTSTNIIDDVYDLMVEEDESFVVQGGIAVHNCFEIARVSQNIITLNRSDDSVKKDRLIFYLEKQRNGKVGIAVECKSDYSRCITHNSNRPTPEEAKGNMWIAHSLNPLLQEETTVGD